MTDRLADNAKKYPLLLIGELSFLTLDARHLAKEDLEQMAEGSLDDFYVLIVLPLSETEESLEILKNLKLSPEQVAMLISADLFVCGLVTLIQSWGATQWFGIRLVFSTAGAALACGVMVFPIMVRAIRLSLEAVDPGLEQAAR